MKIAFIGIGVMGLPMAGHLMDAGHDVKLYTRTKSKADPLVARGAKCFDAIGPCVCDREAIITMVGFPKDVEEVYLGKGGILENAPEGALIIDMTTTSPALWQRIAKKARKRGLRPLDAPVSGGDSGAKAGTLAIMVGGETADFEAALPLFEKMGKTIVHEGGDGAGQHTKMANQIAIAGAVTAVAEAVSYGKATGLDLSKMLGTISTGAAGSWQMSNNGPKMISGDYAPGFFIKHFVKDLRIALEESKERGLELPILKKALKMYMQMEEKGQGDLGTQAIIERYGDDC
ncbi:MAG TPA: NAD(P)-dependent oxidoreductase [Clostridiales bacterium]|jgi:3-hydroxyisobutyrate dehydrogenase/2-hydroxy-3-oxopropionate reductase|nr:NAD(P)-dependent oxidoreductase [Clostridiales bacterium]